MTHRENTISKATAFHITMIATMKLIATQTNVKAMNNLEKKIFTDAVSSVYKTCQSLLII